jgi:type I restriction enzyme S subunit
MKKYDSYKDSGVEWIGELPVDWSCVRLKNIVKEPLKYGANESAEDDNPNNPRYIRITDFGSNGNLKDDTFKSLPFEIAQNYLLEDGDILFARSGATVGKTFLFKNYKGIACYAGYLIKANFDKSKINSTYIDYVTRSNYYENWKSSIFQQATIQNIGADKYNLFKLPIPNRIDEQNAIVDFLDHKTNQIDQLIAKKELFIQLLEEERVAVINQAVTKGLDPTVPMKDSGIEWLGVIPKHWEVKKLKYLVDCNRNTLSENSEPTQIINYIEIGDVNFEKGITGYTEYNFEKAPSRARRIVHSEDVIVSTVRTYLKAIATIKEEYDGFIASTGFAVLTPKEIYFKFLSYLVLTNGFIDSVISLSKGVSYPSITSQDLLNISICLPNNIEEQHAISCHLDTKISQIDRIIAKTRQEIELLKEYKTALISEVVTGKVDVRNEVLD